MNNTVQKSENMGNLTITEENMMSLKERLEKAFGAGYEVDKRVNQYI